MTIALVYAVFADADEAAHVAEAVIAARHAACANLLGPCRSIYRWQGAVERADEAPVLFKTSPARAEALVAAIAALHGYDMPAIVRWTVQADDALTGWAAAATSA